MTARVKAPCGHHFCAATVRILFAERSFFLADIADDLSVSTNTLRSYTERLSLPPRNIDHHKRFAPALLRRLYEVEDLSCTEIAKRLNIHRDTVWRKARKLGFKRPTRNNYRHKIKWPADFDLMWRAGVRQTDIMATADGTVRYFRSVSNEARRRGLPPRTAGCQRRLISLDDYRAMRLGRAMASAARVEQAAMINAEMADKRRDNRMVGSEHARGVM